MCLNTGNLLLLFIYIQVKKDRFEWKLNYLNDTINLRVDGRASDPSVNLYENKENTPTETSSTSCN